LNWFEIGRDVLKLVEKVRNGLQANLQIFVDADDSSIRWPQKSRISGFCATLREK
jgi:hypothetical protein